jgi:hypothetical protein
MGKCGAQKAAVLPATAAQGGRCRAGQADGCRSQALGCCNMVFARPPASERRRQEAPGGLGERPCLADWRRTRAEQRRRRRALGKNNRQPTCELHMTMTAAAVTRRALCRPADGRRRDRRVRLWVECDLLARTPAACGILHPEMMGVLIELPRRRRAPESSPRSDTEATKVRQPSGDLAAPARPTTCCVKHVRDGHGRGGRY